MMTTTDNNLSSFPRSDEEHRELFYRRHPINLLMPALVTLGGIALLATLWWALAAGMTNPDILSYWPYFVLITGLAVFVLLSYFMMQWIFWFFDIWVVNEDKLIDSQLVSFFQHNRSEMPLRQVQDIKFNISGILATLFGCGDVTIQTASKQAFFKLISIPHPKKAVEEISELVQRATSKLYSHNEFVYSPTPILLGELLIQKGLITPIDLAMALEEQKKSNLRLGKILINRGLIQKQDLLNALSAQHRIPEIDLAYVEIDPSVTSCLTKETIHKYNLLPLYRTPNNILMIAVDNLSSALVQEVKDACGEPIMFVIADEDKIKQTINEYYPN
ncbi:MAG: PH domain-containing protein [Patescibacteria group bacterium]|jgi:membrane protein YdbS with pleckstrin-like domain